MREPFFYFCSRSAPQARSQYMTDQNVILLSPHEIVGRTPEGAAGRVVIAPTTFMLLRRNYIIPPGIAGPHWRTIFFWMRLEIQIYCDDAARLQAALAVFWQTSTNDKAKQTDYKLTTMFPPGGIQAWIDRPWLCPGHQARVTQSKAPARRLFLPDDRARCGFG